MQDHRDGECREKNWKLSDGVVDRSVERGRRRGVVFTGKEGEKRRRKKRGKKWREIARNWEEMVYRKGMREGKGGVLRAGIVLIAGFSAVMLGMMSYSFIYLQRDKSACIVPAMYPSYMRLIEFDKRYTKHADKYNLYLYREKKLGNLHDVGFFPGVLLLMESSFMGFRFFLYQGMQGVTSRCGVLRRKQQTSILCYNWTRC